MRIPSNIGFPVPAFRPRHRPAWDRLLSRRQFVSATVLATGATLTSGVWMPSFAKGGAGPRPIPGGIQPFGPGTEVFHLFLPGPGAEPSTITDFKGSVGLAAVQGTGTGSDGKTWLFDADLRFMQGTFVEDDREHEGTFAEV